MDETIQQGKSPRSQSYRLTQPWKVQPCYLLTIPEAAAALCFTEGTLRRYCDRGLIGHLTVRWTCGVIKRHRRYVPKVALWEFQERRQSVPSASRRNSSIDSPDRSTSGS